MEPFAGDSMAQKILSNSFVKGALVGWATAAKQDYAAFKTWKSFQDAMHYNWSVAVWRWIEGAITGAALGGGLNI